MDLSIACGFLDKVLSNLAASAALSVSMQKLLHPSCLKFLIASLLSSLTLLNKLQLLSSFDLVVPPGSKWFPSQFSQRIWFFEGFLRPVSHVFATSSNISAVLIGSSELSKGRSTRWAKLSQAVTWSYVIRPLPYLMGRLSKILSDYGLIAKAPVTLSRSLTILATS